MMGIKMYVAKSINKIIILILVAWEIVMDWYDLERWIYSFTEYL